MFEITVLNTILYGLIFGLTYYILLSFYNKRLLPININIAFTYISLFSVFGISGEIVVNIIWEYIFSQPLWEYHLFPTKDGHISFFFPLIWGLLGFYKYLNDNYLHSNSTRNSIVQGLITGGEAIFIEILYNATFYFLFGSYIFFYLPDNLGIFSHFSCLQVIPFYFMVGIGTQILLKSIMQSNQSLLSRGFTLGFFWMIIASILLA